MFRPPVMLTGLPVTGQQADLEKTKALCGHYHSHCLYSDIDSDCETVWEVAD